MFKKILIINNNVEFTTRLKQRLEEDDNVEVTYFAELNAKVDDIDAFGVFIVHFDKKSERFIKRLSDNDKFVIVTTDEDTEENRKKILSFKLTDYLVVSSSCSCDLIYRTVTRLQSNSKKNILCVDDSPMILTQIAQLLKSQNLNFVQVSDGEKAWQYLSDSKSKHIDLVISDYEMPKMNGYELVTKIRESYSFEELPVLILSGTENTHMISRFLKAGANDYITKPFIKEEFIGRITNSLLLVEMFQKIKSMAMNDQLTGIHNRAYFYDAGVKILEGARRANNPVAIAMIDIDNFKKVNDTYGHEVGDKALIHVANTIKKVLRRSDVFVRFGGEEFVILLPNCPHTQAVTVMEKVCTVISKSPLTLADKSELTITVSIGVTSIQEDIDTMLVKADAYMYHAKNSGKNRVYSEE